MRCFTLITALFFLLAAPAVTAQPHSHGWFVPGNRHLHYVDGVGTVTSVSFSGSYIYAAIMNWDNKTALTYDYTVNSIVQVDPKTLTVVGKMVTDTRLTSNNSIADMAFDSNGDLFVAGYTSIPGLYRWTVSSPTLSLVYNTGSFTRGIGNMSVDPDSGELIAVPAFTGQTTAYLLQRDGSLETQLGTGFYTRYGTYKHIPSGDIYSGSCCGKSGGGSGAALIVLRSGTTTATTLFPNATVRGGYSPWPDRASAARQRLILSTWRETASGTDGLWEVDIASTSMTRLCTISTGNTHKAVHVFGRNLQTIRINQNRWDARLSFPSQGGQGYLLAFSLSGLRPFATLPDGRALPIVPDTLTTVTTVSGLPPVIVNNIGNLNTSGEATCSIDLSTIGPVANGIRVYMLPVVLDSNAPFGIAVIGDPKVLVLEGL